MYRAVNYTFCININKSFLIVFKLNSGVGVNDNPNLSNSICPSVNVKFEKLIFVVCCGNLSCCNVGISLVLVGCGGTRFLNFGYVDY